MAKKPTYEVNEICRGREFLHARYLAGDYRTPARCVITSVTESTVYYRVDIQPGELGRPTTFSPRSEFLDKVAQWCPTEYEEKLWAEWKPGREFTHSSFVAKDGEPARCSILWVFGEFVTITVDCTHDGANTQRRVSKTKFPLEVKEWVGEATDTESLTLLRREHLIQVRKLKDTDIRRDRQFLSKKHKDADGNPTRCVVTAVIGQYVHFRHGCTITGEGGAAAHCTKTMFPRYLKEWLT